MAARVLETRKKSFAGIQAKWRRMVKEDGSRHESWELSDLDFMRLVAAESELKMLKEKVG
jgi:predicted ATP-grasp superfamily ATP-dependent carboligase